MNEQTSWNIPEIPDHLKDREFSGDDTADGMPAVYIIDRAGTFETKSKDKLFIKFDRDGTEKHFSRDWSPKTAVYAVGNLTKIEKGITAVYTVAFYRSKDGEVILASCDCVARVRCKHIVKAWLKHADAEKTGFVPTL